MASDESIDDVLMHFIFLDDVPQALEVPIKNYDISNCVLYFTFAVCLFLILKKVQQKFFLDRSSQPKKNVQNLELELRGFHQQAPVLSFIIPMFRLLGNFVSRPINGLSVSTKKQIKTESREQTCWAKTSPTRASQQVRINKITPQELLKTKWLRSFEVSNVAERKQALQMKNSLQTKSSKKFEENSIIEVVLANENMCLRSLKTSSGEKTLKCYNRVETSVDTENSDERQRLEILQENEVSIYSTQSLIETCNDCLSFHSSEVKFCFPEHLGSPHNQVRKMSQNDEPFDSNTRCQPDINIDKKFPLFLTYPTISRPNLLKKHISPAKSSLRHSDADISCPQKTSINDQGDETMSELSKKIPIVSGNITNVSQKVSETLARNSLEQSDTAKLTRNSKNELKTATHVDAKRDQSQINSAVTSTFHSRATTRKRKTNAGIAELSSKPYSGSTINTHHAEREMREHGLFYGSLDTEDATLKTKYNITSIVQEICAARTRRGALIEERARLSKLDKKHKEGIHQESHTSKDGLKDKFEIGNSAVQQIDLPRECTSMGSKFSEKRRRSSSVFKQNDLSLYKKENGLRQTTREKYASITEHPENDKESVIKEQVKRIENKEHDKRIVYTIRSDIIRHDKRAYNKQFDMRANSIEHDKRVDIKGHDTRTEQNKRSDVKVCDTRTESQEKSNEIKNSFLHSRAHTEMSKEKHRFRACTSNPSVIAGRSESILMVESLLSVNVTDTTDKTLMHASNEPSTRRSLVDTFTHKSMVESSTHRSFADPTAYRSLVPKLEKSVNFSLSTSDKEKKPSSRSTTLADLAISASMEPSYEKTYQTNVKVVKKNPRFLERTINQQKPDNMNKIEQVPYSIEWNHANKTMPQLSENYEDHTREKKSYNNVNDYPMVLDKFIRKSKNHIKNTILLCKSAKTTMYEKLKDMKPEGPGSVRASKLRQMSARFPTLMSFLDHIEKEDKERFEQLKGQRGTQENVRKKGNKVETAATDKLNETFFCHDRPGKRTFNVHMEPKKKMFKGVSTAVTGSHLETVLHEHGKSSDGALHFGTNELELYSESGDSVNCLKEDVKQDVNVHRKSCHTSAAISQHGPSAIKRDAAGHIETGRWLKKPKLMPTTSTVLRKAKTAQHRHWKKDALKNMKKIINEKIDKSERKKEKLMTAALKIPTAKMEKERQNKQCEDKQKDFKKPKSQNKITNDIAQSLFASCDPTRKSEHLIIMNSSNSPVNEAMQIANSQSLIKGTISEKTKTGPAVRMVPDASGRQQLNAEGGLGHKSKSRRPMKTNQLLSSHEADDFAENICSVVKNNRSDLHSTELKGNSNLHSPRRTTALMIKPVFSEFANKKCKAWSPCRKSASHTQSRLLQRAHKRETSRNMLSVDTRAIKLHKENSPRDINVPSPCKSIVLIDAHATSLSPNVDPKSTLPIFMKLQHDMAQCDPVMSIVLSRSETHYPTNKEISLIRSTTTLKKQLAFDTSHSEATINSVKPQTTQKKNQRPCDLLKQYLVHTTEHPQINEARTSVQNIPQMKSSDVHQRSSSPEANVPVKSPDVKAKLDVPQLSCSSYTSKHKAHDNTAKGLKSPWRGTVAFRKRLQHLLQNNKDLQTKQKHLNMHPLATKTTSPNKVSSRSAKTGKILNLYKVSQIARPDYGLPHEIGKTKNRANTITVKQDQTRNIQWSKYMTSPVSKTFNMQCNRNKRQENGKSNKSSVLSVEIPARIKTGIGVNSSLLKLNSSAAARNDGNMALSSDTTMCPKHILTHSDVFEQQIYSRIKRRKEEMEHKLKHVQCICEIGSASAITQVGGVCTSSQTLPVTNSESNESSGALLNQPAFNLNLDLSSPHKCISNCKMLHVANVDTQSRDTSMGVETGTTAHEAITLHSLNSRTCRNRLISEGVAVKTDTGKWENNFHIDNLEQDSINKVENVNTQQVTLRHDIVGHSRREVCSGSDTQEYQKSVVENINLNDSLDENNLQQLLDKIRQSCSVARINMKDREIKNTISSSTLKDKSSVKYNVKKIKSDISSSLRKSKNMKLATLVPLIYDTNEKLQQARPSYITDKTVCLGTPSTQGDSCSQDTIIKEEAKIDSHSSVTHSLDSQSNFDITSVHGDNYRRDNLNALSGAEHLEIITTDRITVVGQDGTSGDDSQSTNKDWAILPLKPRILRNRSHLTTKGFQNSKTTSPYERKAETDDEKDSVVGSIAKYVGFGLKDEINKCEVESQVIVNSEVALQESSKTVSVNTWHAMISDTDITQNVPQEIKPKQIRHISHMSDKAELSSLRQDAQVDPSSEGGHSLERQHSTLTEAAGKSQCSSGYATMETRSATSLSRSQNSRTLEPEKHTSELAKAREGLAQIGTNEDRHKNMLVNSSVQDQRFHESWNRISETNSQTASLWKKDLHMDVIPEEVDYESCFESCKSVLDKSTEPRKKRDSVDDAALVQKIVPNRKEDDPVTDHILFDASGKTNAGENKKDNDFTRLVNTETAKKNEELYGENVHPSTTSVHDKRHLEITRAERGGLLARSRKNLKTEKIWRSEVLEHLLEEELSNPSDEITDLSMSSHSKDTRASSIRDQDANGSSDLHRTVIQTVTEFKHKEKDPPLSNAHLSRYEPYYRSPHQLFTPNSENVDATNIVSQSKCEDGTLVNETNKEQLAHQTDERQNSKISIGTKNPCFKINLSLASESVNTMPLHSESVATATTIEIRDEVLQGKSSTEITIAEQEKSTNDSWTAIEISHKSVLAGVKNQHALATSQVKPKGFEVNNTQEPHIGDSFSLESVGSSQLEDSMYNCNEQRLETSNKFSRQAITKRRDAVDQVNTWCSQGLEESAKSKQSLLKTVISSTQMRKSNSEESTASNKCSEHSKKSDKTLCVKSVNLFMTDTQRRSLIQENIPCLKVKSFESSRSESSIKSSIRAVSACKRALNVHPLQKCDAAGHHVLENDIASAKKYVGLQKENVIVIESGEIKIDSSAINTHCLKMSPSVSELTSEIDKLVHDSSTKNMLCSGSKANSGKIDQMDDLTKSQNQEQNFSTTNCEHSTEGQIEKERNPNLQNASWKTDPEEKSIINEADDLESLLNKELVLVYGVSALNQCTELKRLFPVAGDRRTKRKRRAKKSSSQLSNQQELYYHILRENDGSLKGISSSTSQATVVSTGDTAMQHHSRRPVKSLAHLRNTKLEEFLQKAEGTNKPDALSLISRAVSKLSSFTSVTPSSQEEDQILPLQTVNRGKATNFRSSVHRAGEQSCPLSSKKDRAKEQLHEHVSEESRRSNSSKIENANSTSCGGQSMAEKCQMDASGNIDTTNVTSDPNHRLNVTKESGVYDNKSNDTELEISVGKTLGSEVGLITLDSDETQQIAAVDKKPNSHRVKDKISKESTIRTFDVDSCLANTGASTVISKYQPCTTGMPQATEESSALSTSSSSIVLSWIGSDLADVEDTILIPPNLANRYGKLYSDINAEQSNGYPCIFNRDSEKSTALSDMFTSGILRPYDEMDCLSRPTCSTDISKAWMMATTDLHGTGPRQAALNDLSDIATRSTKYNPARSTIECDMKTVSEKSVTKSPLHEDAEISMLGSLQENKDCCVAQLPLPCKGDPSFSCPNKQQTCGFKCSTCETDLKSKSSVKPLMQCWGDRKKTCTLDQPSYFSSLLRDPKWNSYFAIEEDHFNVDQYADQSSLVRNYVQSALTYQQMRNASPVFSLKKEQHERRSSVCSHPAKLQFQIHNNSTTDIAPSPYTVKSNINIHSQNSVGDNRYKRTKMPAENAATQTPLQSPSACHIKQELKQKGDRPAGLHFKTGGLEKENSFLRKVHFDNFEHSDKSSTDHCTSVVKHKSLSLAVPCEAKDKSKDRISLNEHLKASVKSSGPTCNKDRFYPKQQPNSTDSSPKTRKKVSLEQHLCSTSDTEKNAGSRPNGAEPESENGTTKSTSSHASLNWYKPQSLPSSTSVSNGNAAPRPKETHGLPRAPLSELEITLSSRPRNTELMQRQNSESFESGTNLSHSLASSSVGYLQGKVSSQRSTKIACRVHSGSSLQSFNTELGKDITVSLSMPSAATLHDDKRQFPGFKRFRDSSTIRSTRQALPPSQSGSSSRLKGHKSSHLTTSASDTPRSESKPSTTYETAASANHSLRQSCSNGKSIGSFKKRSSHSVQSMWQKKCDATYTRINDTLQTDTHHFPVLKRVRTSNEGSANQAQEQTKDEGTTRGTISTRRKQRLSLRSARDSSMLESSTNQKRQPSGSSPFKVAKRVSRLVEMFEKKMES